MMSSVTIGRVGWPANARTPYQDSTKDSYNCSLRSARGSNGRGRRCSACTAPGSMVVLPTGYPNPRTSAELVHITPRVCWSDINAPSKQAVLQAIMHGGSPRNCSPGRAKLICSSGRLKFFRCHSTSSAHAITCMLLFDTCNNKHVVRGYSQGLCTVKGNDAYHRVMKA